MLKTIPPVLIIGIIGLYALFFYNERERYNTTYDPAYLFCRGQASQILTLTQPIEPPNTWDSLNHNVKAVILQQKVFKDGRWSASYFIQCRK